MRKRKEQVRRGCWESLFIKCFLLREILRLEVRVCRVQCFSYNLISHFFYSFHLFMAKNYVKNHVQK